MKHFITRFLLLSGAMLVFGTNGMAQLRDRETETPSAAGLLAAAAKESVFSIGAPAFIIAKTDPGKSEASTVELGTPLTTGTIAVERITNDAPERFPLGTTIITWTANDAEGRTATTMQTVLVQDVEIPKIAAPSPVAVVAEAGQNEVPATSLHLGFPMVNDNCPGLGYSHDAPQAFPVGTTTVVWTVTDASGNVATSSQMVTVLPDMGKTASAQVVEK